MRKLIFAISAIAVAGSTAYADPVEDREALMKANGAAAGTLAPFARGSAPYDAAAVLAALTRLRDDAQRMEPSVVWPEGSGEGTRSSPKIWEDPAGFQAEIDKFRRVTAEAVDAAPQDAAALGTHFAAIGESCSTCHEAYRLSRN